MSTSKAKRSRDIYLRLPSGFVEVTTGFPSIAVLNLFYGPGRTSKSIVGHHHSTIQRYYKKKRENQATLLLGISLTNLLA
jgi:hypothetical protein